MRPASSGRSDISSPGSYTKTHWRYKGQIMVKWCILERLWLNHRNALLVLFNRYYAKHSHTPNFYFSQTSKVSSLFLKHVSPRICTCNHYRLHYHRRTFTYRKRLIQWRRWRPPLFHSSFCLCLFLTVHKGLGGSPEWERDNSWKGQATLWVANWQRLPLSSFPNKSILGRTQLRECFCQQKSSSIPSIKYLDGTQLHFHQIHIYS